MYKLTARQEREDDHPEGAASVLAAAGTQSAAVLSDEADAGHRRGVGEDSRVSAAKRDGTNHDGKDRDGE